MSATAEQIREGIALNMKAIPGLNAHPYVFSSPSPPSATVVRAPINYDEAFQGGTHKWVFNIVVQVATLNEIGAQKLLDEYLAPEGERSIKEAIEADRTLGGVVADLHVTQASGEQPFMNEGGGPFLGSVWTVEVWL